MDKYHKIDEYIDSLKLGNEAVINYKRTLKEYDEIIELEAAGSLSELDEGRKKEKERDLDNFITDFIETRKNEIEEDIDKFRKKVEEINQKFEEIKSGFVLGTGVDLRNNEAMIALNADLAELGEEVKGIISEIDEFKSYVSGFGAVEFTMNYNDINKQFASLKTKVKELKQHQIDRYNARVLDVNRMIDELKGIQGLTPEVMARINSLSNLSTCSISIRSWNETKYLQELDYEGLVKTIASIEEIQKEVKLVEEKKEIVSELDSDMGWIEWNLDGIDNSIASAKTFSDLENLKQRLSRMTNRITEFNVKLNNNKELLTPEELKQYEDRINDAQSYVAEINDKIDNYSLERPVVSEYEVLNGKLNTLNGEVVNLSNLIEALYGKVTLDAIQPLENNLNTLVGRLEDIDREIEEKHNEGKLDENQYNELKKKVEEITKVLEETRTKLKEPEMGKDVDVFAFLNGEIDGLEAAVAALEARVDSLEKPIKDKDTRKEIDKTIERLEKEAKNIAVMLEKHKEEDPEKYEAAKARLEEINKRLDKVGKNYRKKCPLMVRAYKSAKNFYKKHKKACLIIAGLAAIALIHATVGPVLIPAIMHGNIMIGSTVPSLGGFTAFVNNILGGLINAQQLGSTWFLSNGVALTSSAVGLSGLLKGIAVAGLGTTAALAPMIAAIVAAIKKLSPKMKEKDLKTRIKEEQEKIKKKKDEKKKNPGKKKTKQADKMSVEELAKLLKEFRKSGKSLDEFCLENELSEEEKAIIQYLDEQSKKNEETLENTGRRGR